MAHILPITLIERALGQSEIAEREQLERLDQLLSEREALAIRLLEQRAYSELLRSARDAIQKAPAPRPNREAE